MRHRHERRDDGRRQFSSKLKGTAEGVPFSRAEMNALLDLAQRRDRRAGAASERHAGRLTCRTTTPPRRCRASFWRRTMRASCANSPRCSRRSASRSSAEQPAVPEAEEPFGTFIECADEGTPRVAAHRAAGDRRRFGPVRARAAQRAGRLFGTLRARGAVTRATRRTTRISSSSCAASTTGAHTIAACSRSCAMRTTPSRCSPKTLGGRDRRHAARRLQFGYDPYFYLPSLGATARRAGREEHALTIARWR